MRVPAIIYADRALLVEMDDKVLEQLTNVATLPGIVEAAYAMPDAHWGYGFSIGGVAAFDPEEGGVVSAGGVGFDISCGVRLLLTRLPSSAITAVQEQLAEALFRRIPAGVGSEGSLTLTGIEMDAMLRAGARPGPSSAATARRPIWCGSRKGGACLAPSQTASRRTPTGGSGARSAPSAAAIILWKCRP